MKVAILHDPVAADATPDELDTLRQVEAVEAALRQLGEEVSRVQFGLDLAAVKARLAAQRPTMIFNLVEAVDGRENLSYLAPALLEAWSWPFTGSTAAALLISSDKLLAKERLRAAGLPTPEWLSSGAAGGGPAAEERFPGGSWIIKSVREHASRGLDAASVVEAADWSELRARLAARAAGGGEWFAERYVDGREFNLALLAGPNGGRSLPPAEIKFVDFPPDRPKIVDYQAKWAENSFEYAHTVRAFDFPPTDAKLLAQVRELAQTCWPLFGLGGYARVDFRIDAAGRPWILEINANPCLSPDAGFAAAATQANLSYPELIGQICRQALTAR